MTNLEPEGQPLSNLIHFEGGEVLASLETRTITGRLLPFNEEGRTNLGRLTVPAGTISVPADPLVVGLNTDHQPSDTVGRAAVLDTRDDGIYASFTFAKTPEGDAALADALSPTGKRRKLSAEFGPVQIKDGKVLASSNAKLWGAALVEAGAFPSAMVLAADTPDEIAAPDTATDTAANPDENGHLEVLSDTLPTDITATTPDGDSATYTPEATPAEANQEGGSTVTASAVATAGATSATIARTQIPGAAALAGGAAAAPVATQVFAAVANLLHNPGDLAARQVLAELTDIKVSGDGALPGAGVLQPNWVGELTQGVDYVREYVTLGKLGTDISIAGKKGFSVKRGTAGAPLDRFDGTWAGNKTAVNSYGGISLTSESYRRNFAIAEDVAREFYDLPGGAEVVEAFFKLIIADYFRQTDEWALEDWQTAAGVPVAPATAKYATSYPAALGMILQGILAVKKRKSDGRRDIPSFAIANAAAYEELIYAAGGAENLPAFVQIALTTASNGTIDGNVQIIEGETGITDTASAIVGAQYAIEFDEVPGGPLQIDALNIANGGIDKAVHGYLQTFITRPEAVVLVGAAAARANSTAVLRGSLLKRGSNTYRVTVSGTTASSAPTEPAVGTTVVDGTATLLRLA